MATHDSVLLPDLELIYYNTRKIDDLLSSITGVHIEEVGGETRRSRGTEGGLKVTIGGWLAAIGLAGAETTARYQATKDIAESYKGHLSLHNKIEIMERYYCRLKEVSIIDMRKRLDSGVSVRRFGSVRGLFEMRDARNERLAPGGFSELYRQHADEEDHGHAPFWLVSSRPDDLMVYVPVLPKFFDFDTGSSQWFYVKVNRMEEGMDTTMRLAVVGTLAWDPDNNAVSVSPLAMQLAERPWGWPSRDPQSQGDDPKNPAR